MTALFAVLAVCWSVAGAAGWLKRLDDWRDLERETGRRMPLRFRAWFDAFFLVLAFVYGPAFWLAPTPRETRERMRAKGEL